MSALKKLTASVCVAALVSVVPLAGAQAGDYYHGSHGYYDDYHYGGHYGHGYHKRHHGHRGHHHYHKKKRGKAWVPVAIVGGIAAAYLIGKAIEDNHHKKKHYRGGYHRPHSGYNQGSYHHAPPPAPAPAGTGQDEFSGLAGGPGSAAPISSAPVSTGPCRTVYRDGYQNGQPVQIASTLCQDQNGFGYIMPNSERVVASGYGR